MGNETTLKEAGNSGRGEWVPGAIAMAENSLSREFHNFVMDVEELITSSTSFTGADLAVAKEKLNERVTAAKESLASMGSAVNDSVRQTDYYVHEQPWQAIGLSAAVGFVLGLIFSRRA